MSNTKDRLNSLASQVSGLLDSGDASLVFSAVNAMDPAPLEGLKTDVLIGSKMADYKDRREQISDLLDEIIQGIRSSDENVEKDFWK